MYIKIIAQTDNRLAFHLSRRAENPRLDMRLTGYPINGTPLQSMALCIDGAPFFVADYDVIFDDDEPEFECSVKYALIGDWMGLNDDINKPFENMRRSFNILCPLLSMLPAGKYNLKIRDFFPFYKNGVFFWNLKEHGYMEPVSASFFNSVFQSVIPTKPPETFNIDRVSYYREKRGIYGVCLEIEDDVYLLDGHHKVSAAALDGRKARCIVISHIAPVFKKVNSSQSALQLAENICKKSNFVFPTELLECYSKYEMDDV
jgi:hypothetical protein